MVECVRKLGCRGGGNPALSRSYKGQDKFLVNISPAWHGDCCTVFEPLQGDSYCSMDTSRHSTLQIAS
jgi:hypothetical protein